MLNNYSIPQSLHDLMKEEFDLNVEIAKLANAYDPFPADGSDPGLDPLEVWKANSLISALNRKKSSLAEKIKSEFNILLSEGKL